MTELTKEEIKALPIARVVHGELRGRDYYANPSPWLSYELYDLTKAEYVAKVDGQHLEIQPEIIWELVNDKAKMPSYNNEKDGSACGMDFYSPVALTIPARGKANVKLGIKSRIPPGYMVKIEARSGTSWKFCIETGAGVIDWGYADEWGGVIYNNSDSPYRIEIGDRICQGVMYEFARPSMRLGSTTGTRGGFGSSGR